MENKVSIKTRLDHLKASKEGWAQISRKMLEAENGNIYPLDLFILGIVKRSMMLTSGFCQLMEQDNFLSAAPIIRLHLDNLLNMHAAFIVNNPQDFAMCKMRGEQTKKLKDKNGANMTDTHLAESLSKNTETAWVLSVYRETSRFVHASDKHIFSAVEKIEGNDFNFVISDTQTIPEENAIKATNAMISITEQLFRYAYGWVRAKNEKQKKL